MKTTPEDTDMDCEDWCGWSITGEPDLGALHIGPLPGRKQIALYQMRGGSSSVLAYFKDEDQARSAAEWIDGAMAKANLCASALNKLLYGGVTS